jgi:hypothetical protein
MPTADDRLALVEGRVQEQTGALNDVRAAIRDIRAEIAMLRTDVRSEMAAFGTELRADVSAFRGELREDIQRLDEKMDRRFMWLVGLQAVTTAAILTAVATGFFR